MRSAVLEVAHVHRTRARLVLALTLALVAALVAVPRAAQADSLAAPALSAPADAASVSTNPVFSWSAVPLATKYRIQVSTSPTFSSVQYTADVFGTSATPTAELPVGTLYWRVASIDSTSTLGTYSDSRTVTRTSPTAPGLVSPADGHAFVYPAEPPVLRWSPVPGMVSYKVQVDDDPGFVGATSVTTQGTSYSPLTSLPTGTVRYWRVQGVSTTAAITTLWSSDTDLRSFTVSWPSSAKPTLLTPDDDLVTPVDDVTYSWTPVLGAAKYEVQTSTAANFSANVVTTTTWATQLRRTDTPAAAQYYWRVRALDASGNATDWSDHRGLRRAWLEDATHRARPELAALTDVDSGTSGVQVATNQVTLSWTPVPRASKYEVELSTDSAFLSSDSDVRRTCVTAHTTWTPVQTGDYTGTSGFTNCAWAGTSTGSPTDYFIRPGVTYYARVRAVDTTPSGGTIYSSWSNEATADSASPGETQFTTVADPRSVTDPTKPAEPLSSPSGEDNPLLKWSPVSGAAAYLVWLANDDGFTNNLLTSGGGTYAVTTQTQIVVSDVLLDNNVGESYRWFVLPCSRWDGAVDPDNVCSVGPNQAINNPTYATTFTKHGLPVAGVTGSGTQTDTVAMSWSDQTATSPAGGGVKWYQLQVLSSGGTVVDDVLTDATGYTPIAESYVNGPYTWRVRAIDAAGQSLDWSASTAFTKSSSAPVSHDDETAAVALPVLDWDPTAFAKSYEVEVYRGTDPTFPSGNLVTTLTPAYAAVALSDTIPPGDYSWRVRQKDFGDRTGPWSAGTPDFTVAEAAASLSSPADAAGTPTQSLRFEWSSVSGAVRYKVQTAVTNGFGTLFEDVTTIGNAYAPVKAYVGGTTYYWRVQVLNADSDIVSTSPVRSFVAQSTPNAPTATGAADGTTLTVSWTAPATGGSALTGYSVRYRQFGTTGWTVLDRAADTTSVAVGGLATSTKYEAQVSAVNALGAGSWSNLVSGTTDTVPSAPTGLKVTAGNGQLTVSWTKPSDGGSTITGYLVRWTPTGGGTSQNTVTGTSTVLTGLTNGVGYAVDVAAVNAVGTGGFASAVQGVPAASTTPTPTPTTTTRPPTSTGTTATAVTVSGGRTVVYGAGATLTGTLKTSSGTGLTGRTVTVQSRAVGSTTWGSAATATTGTGGAWSATVKPSANREFRATFAASSPYGASTSSTTTVLVAPKITRQLSDTSVKKGAKVTFTGTVSPVHKGQTVSLQRLKAGKWVTAKSVTTSTSSTYKIVWKTDSSTDYRWRVFMAKDSQHAAGKSAKILLTVK